MWVIGESSPNREIIQIRTEFSRNLLRGEQNINVDSLRKDHSMRWEVAMRNKKSDPYDPLRINILAHIPSGNGAFD